MNTTNLKPLLSCTLRGQARSKTAASTCVNSATRDSALSVNQHVLWNAGGNVDAAGADITLGGGMLSYFTELNRKPVPKGVFDFITHTVCPIVHAADDISVIVHSLIVRSAGSCSANQA